MTRTPAWRRAVAIAVLFLVLTGCNAKVQPETVQRRVDRLVASMAAKPLSDTARALVQAVRELGDSAYGAYLLDLVRVGFSSTAASEALETLALLSGIPRDGGVQTDYLTYGRWVLNDAPTPKADYAGFKAAVYYQVDPDFVPLLLKVTNVRLLAGLQYGGVGVGAIGELNAPPTVSMTQPQWAQPDEQIYGLVGAQGTALAYPERILARHELSNDTLDNIAVAVTFCTLCRAVRVYDRRVDGRVLTFKTSGLLLGSNKVMVDTETQSLWQQYNGQAIAGPLVGKQLAPIDVEVTNWATWLAAYPAGVVVDKPLPTVIDSETGQPIGYDYEPGAALDHYYSSTQLWYPVLASPADIDAKAEVATLELDGRRLAVSVSALAASGPRVFAVGSRRIVAVPVPDSVRFYDATSTDWKLGPTDDAVASLAERNLAKVPNAQSFWFAWWGAHSDTDWWPRLTLGAR